LTHHPLPPPPVAATAQVRQSAFALVGDLARCCVSTVVPRLGELLTLALANLEPRMATADGNNSASNNACWALGEIAIKVSGEACLTASPPAQLPSWAAEAAADLPWFLCP
jgi:hypothetical protein